MPRSNKNSLAVIRKKKKELADQNVHLVDENAQLKDRIVELEIELELISKTKNDVLRSSSNGTGTRSRVAAAKKSQPLTADWRDSWTFDLRNCFIERLVKLLLLRNGDTSAPGSWVEARKDARMMENDMFASAQDESTYLKMVAKKFGQMHKERRSKRKGQLEETTQTTAITGNGQPSLTTATDWRAYWTLELRNCIVRRLVKYLLRRASISASAVKNQNQNSQARVEIFNAKLGARLTENGMFFAAQEGGAYAKMVAKKFGQMH